MKTKVAYFWQLVEKLGFYSTVLLDFKREKTDGAVLLEKSIAEITEEEALWIVSLAKYQYDGKYLDEVNYLRNKYKSVEGCFEKKKRPLALGGDDYEVFIAPHAHKYLSAYQISERLYNDAVKNKI